MADELEKTPAPKRVVSIDALRGFDMMWIMGGDSIGGAVAALLGVHHAVAVQLEHVPWQGYVFYDLIFPTFVFLAGVSLVFSLGRIREQSGKDAALVRLLQRAAFLYVLGLFYYGLWSKGFDQIRWVGVLQRIAISYLGAGFLFIFYRPRTLAIISGVILLAYWALLTQVPIPGVGVGDLREGPAHNVVNWFDSRFLPGYRWDGRVGTENGTHDPEGILSSIPAIVSCLLGVFAGLVIKDEQRKPAAKAAWIAGYGLALLAAGTAFSFVFPVIKKLWTSSYVLVAAGWSSLALAAFYYVIDVRGWQRWAQPFVWVGLNPITIYLLGNLVNFDALGARLVGGKNAAGVWHGLGTWHPGMGALVVAVLGILWGFWVARILHRHRLYLRV